MNYLQELFNTYWPQFIKLVEAVTPAAQKLLTFAGSGVDLFQEKTGVHLATVAKFIGNTFIASLQVFIDLVRWGMSISP